MRCFRGPTASGGYHAGIEDNGNHLRAFLPRTGVPLHREIRPGTLSDILHQTALSKEDLVALL